MQPDAQVGQVQPRVKHFKAMMAYGLGFGALAAAVSIAYLLFRAYQEIALLQTPVPTNSLGFHDYIPMLRWAEYFPYLVALPVDGIILICVTIATFLSARHTRNRSAGFGAALITFFFGFALYATASVLVAKYLLDPVIPFGDPFFVGSTVPALAICITPVLVLTAGFAEWAVSWTLPERR